MELLSALTRVMSSARDRSLTAWKHKREQSWSIDRDKDSNRSFVLGIVEKAVHRKCVVSYAAYLGVVIRSC